MLTIQNSRPDIQENLRTVKEQIAIAASEAARDPMEIKLVAVTKLQGLEDIQAALKAKHKIFGENRVQEAEGKWLNLREKFSGLQLHMIGPLQRNKVKRAVKLFDVIETIDRPELAHAIAKEIRNLGRQLNCFIQVNTGEESQKAGVMPVDVDAIIDLCRDKLGLPLAGLMCIPPLDEEPGLHFGLLAEMARRNGLTELSMGMSGDYKAAVRFGATYVRVGAAIFGERRPFAGSDE